MYVKVGDVIAAEDAKVADYGATGKYGGSPHLHIELDSDINYAVYSPTLARSSNIWKAGTDSTVNPMEVFKIDASGQRGYKQTFSHANASGAWVQPDDKTPFDSMARSSSRKASKHNKTLLNELLPNR